jgi:hypothetical protein
VDRRRERWPWLFPATYVLHIAEEYAGGFPRWMGAISGARLTEQDFLLINAAAFVVMTTMTAVGASGAARWPLVALGTIVATNAVLHIGGSVLTASYSPGAITATLLWLPLGIYALRRLRHEVPGRAYAAGIAAGVALHVLVSALAFFG